MQEENLAEVPLNPLPQNVVENDQQSGMSQDTKTIITVLLLVFACPLGMIFVWRWMKWPTWIKVLLTLVFMVFIVIPALLLVLLPIIIYIIRPV